MEVHSYLHRIKKAVNKPFAKKLALKYPTAGDEEAWNFLSSIQKCAWTNNILLGVNIGLLRRSQDRKAVYFLGFL